MKEVLQGSLSSGTYLIVLLLATVSTALLGALSLLQGYLPFSPIYFASHPYIAFSLYAFIVLGLACFELRETALSVELQAQDSQFPFRLYVGTGIICFLFLFPICWFKTGQSALAGASIDEVIYFNSTWILYTILGVGALYLLRWKTLEAREIDRVRHKFDAHQMTYINQATPEWHSSDMWEPVSITNEEFDKVSQVNMSTYQRRRQQKLTRENQTFLALKVAHSQDQLSHHHLSSSTDQHDYPNRQRQFTAESFKYKYASAYESAFDDYNSKNNQSETLEPSLALPSWLREGRHQQTQDMSLDTSVRRSVDDFDTRFEPRLMNNAEILGENSRWSGISRPASKPKTYSVIQPAKSVQTAQSGETNHNDKVAKQQIAEPQQKASQSQRVITQGFTPLMVGETPIENALPIHQDKISSPLVSSLSEDQVEVQKSLINTSKKEDRYKSMDIIHHEPKEVVSVDQQNKDLDQPHDYSIYHSFNHLSDEDLQLFEEVNQVLQNTKVQYGAVPSSSLHSSEESLSTHSLEVERMSFSKLSELSCSKVTIDPVKSLEQINKPTTKETVKQFIQQEKTPKQTDLLNPTLVDAKTWQ